jgi:hypothetical protein
MTYVGWIFQEDYAMFKYRMEGCKVCHPQNICTCIWNNLQAAKHAVLNLGRVCSVRFFQLQWLSIRIPKNFVLIVSYMNLFAYSITSGECNEFIGVNFTIYIFSVFKTSWLALNCFLKMRLRNICSLCSYYQFPRHLCN